jgi:hypothetical protein
VAPPQGELPQQQAQPASVLQLPVPAQPPQMITFDQLRGFRDAYLSKTPDHTPRRDRITASYDLMLQEFASNTLSDASLMLLDLVQDAFSART